PRRVARDDRHEVGVEDRREDDGGIARIGEVVHRPREDLALGHAGVERAYLSHGFIVASLACPSSSARSRFSCRSCAVSGTGTSGITPTPSMCLPFGSRKPTSLYARSAPPGTRA